MIEFKADCGHVIQAPDQDAGKIVKCAYCGREVEAPLRDEEDPDLLFQEVDLNELAKSESLAGVPGAMTIQGHQKKAKSAPSAEDIAQTGDRVLRISSVVAFFTICLVVLVLVILSISKNLNSAVPRLSERADRSERHATPPQTPLQDLPSNSVDTPGRSEQSLGSAEPVPLPSGGRVGYSFSSTSQGVFVEVFNPAARIYVRDQESPKLGALGADELERQGSGRTQIHLDPGQYRLGVILPADDQQLTLLTGFDHIRPGTGSADADADLAEFFALDTSSETAFIEDSESAQSVVRYYDITVQPNEWTLVTSLFTPLGPIKTMLSYIPNQANYSFDEEAAREELDAHGIAAVKVSSMIDMLARAGQVVVPATDRGDGEFDIFEIDVRDGSVRTREMTLPDYVGQQVAGIAGAAATPQPRSGGVWGSRSRKKQPSPAADQTELEPSLQVIQDQLREKLRSKGNVNADDVRPYLAGGTEYAIWQAAEAGTRKALVELLEKDTAASLVQELGQTMLNDPDLEVRLALLNSLVLAADKRAIGPIDQRLDAIEDDDTIDPEEADREEKELGQARSDLSPPRGKSPWNR